MAEKKHTKNWQLARENKSWAAAAKKKKKQVRKALILGEKEITETEIEKK